MNTPVNRAGLGLIEILVGSVCFLIAVLPIMSLFSFNVENARIIQARALTYSAAQEILEQARILPAVALPFKAEQDLPLASGPFRLVTQDPRTEIRLSELPASYSRQVIIEKNGPDTGTVKVRVRTRDQPRADIELELALVTGLPMGGRP